MAIHIPPSDSGALPLVAGRPDNHGLVKETRSRMERITAQLKEKPCGACGSWPPNIIRLDELYSVGQCACGNLIGYSVNIEATRPESPAQKKAAALRALELRQLTAHLRGRR